MAGDKINYKHGLSTTSALELPPQINSSAIDPAYSVPDQQTFSKFIEARNSSSGSNGNKANAILSGVPEARIDRDGQRRWLVVNRSPEQVWPKLEKFWTDLGFKLVTNSPKTGIMETNWLENRANTPNGALRDVFKSILDFAFSSDKKDKFKTRIELNNGSTEIYVTHNGVEEQFSDKQKDSTAFYKRAAEPELEAEILRKMMISLGLNDGQANYLSTEYKKITDIPTTAKARSTIQDISIANSPENAWRSIGIALDRAGFTIENRSLAKLNYTIRYLDPDQFNQQPGFFARISKGQRIDELRKSRVYTVQVSTSQVDKNSSKITIINDPTLNVGFVTVDSQSINKTNAKILSVIQENL
jgi:outer membrane protein assembly factor BamC